MDGDHVVGFEIGGEVGMEGDNFVGGFQLVDLVFVLDQLNQVDCGSAFLLVHGLDSAPTNHAVVDVF